MRRLAFLLFLLAGCSSNQVLSACQAHTAGIAILAPQAAAGALTQAQVGAVDTSIAITDPICAGTVTDFSTALTVMESELMRLTIIGASNGN